jgi:sialic acid synthase SpsE
MTRLIAEFCQNHKGDRTILGEMIHAAAENGATYAKIQSIWARDVTRRERFELGETGADGQVRVIKRPYQAEVERLKQLELSIEDHRWFIEECQRRKLIPLTTVFTLGTVPEIAALPWPQRVVKLASYDCASLPLIKALKPHFDTLFISTGATHDEEIERTAAELSEHKLVFFHCVTKYPNRLQDCNLARLDYLRKFSKEVGWSDHSRVATDGIKAAMVALALGADYVERHFTILAPEETKDGPVSIRPNELCELADFAKLSRADREKEARRTIPEFESMMGSSNRAISHEELLNRDYFRGRFATHINGEPRYNWEEPATVGSTKGIGL